MSPQPPLTSLYIEQPLMLLTRLAQFSGDSAAYGNSVEPDATGYPMRDPYACPMILRSFCTAHSGCLLGCFGLLLLSVLENLTGLLTAEQCTLSSGFGAVRPLYAPFRLLAQERKSRQSRIFGAFIQNIARKSKCRSRTKCLS